MVSLSHFRIETNPFLGVEDKVFSIFPISAATSINSLFVVQFKGLSPLDVLFFFFEPFNFLLNTFLIILALC